LNDKLIELDEKVGGLLERNSRDFLAAYRGHMVKIQKELEFLRKKANE
jgi:hypothetical protein